MKVLFMTNIPSPYRVDFFNELGKFCDLTVTFTKKSFKHRDKSWQNFNFKNFKGIFLKGFQIKNKGVCFGLKKIIKKGRFDKIICADFTSPTGILIINYLKRNKIPYFLESDGGYAKSGKGFIEKLKKKTISGATGYFSTSKENDNYYLTYGATEDNLIRYPFTSLDKKDIIEKVPTFKEKQELREKLQIKEEKVVLAVGQFVHRKGFDILLKASKNFNNSVGFYFIGGEPTEEYLNYKADNIHFIGFKTKADLNEYYQMADVFVLPTREDIWGLVINEAMANGLPVITTNKCIAGLELVDDTNGKIVSVDDVDGFVSAIQSVFNQNCEVLAKNSLNKIKSYTIQNMAKFHLEILSK